MTTHSCVFGAGVVASCVFGVAVAGRGSRDERGLKRGWKVDAETVRPELRSRVDAAAAVGAVGGGVGGIIIISALFVATLQHELSGTDDAKVVHAEVLHDASHGADVLWTLRAAQDETRVTEQRVLLQNLIPARRVVSTRACGEGGKNTFNEGK